MKKVFVASLSAALAAGVALSAPVAEAAPKHHPPAKRAASGEPLTVSRDELPNAAESKRRALREEAITQVLNGEATPVKRGKSTVVKLGKGNKAQFAELSRTTTDRVFVILAEFGNDRHPTTPTRTPTPPRPVRPPSTARWSTRSPSPTVGRQLDRVAAPLRQGALREHVLR